MLRYGLIALGLVFAGPTLAVTPIYASLGPSLEASEVLARKPQALPPVLLTGVPKGWDRLRGQAPASDICAAIRSQAVPGGQDLPFDPAAIVAEALGQEFCAES